MRAFCALASTARFHAFAGAPVAHHSSPLPQLAVRQLRAVRIIGVEVFDHGAHVFIGGIGHGFIDLLNQLTEGWLTRKDALVLPRTCVAL